jgi:hypothetical protein
MPTFKHTNTHTNRRFQCRLQCGQCTAQTAQGARCRRRVCEGTDTCWTHRKRDLGLRVARSSIAGAGRGVFATRRLPANTIIARYDGQKLTDAQLDARYGTDADNGHAPYGLQVTQQGQHVGKTVDAACMRSLGSLINGSRTRGTSNVRYSNRANADGSINIYTRKRAILPGTELLSWYGTGYWASSAHSRHTTK